METQFQEGENGVWKATPTEKAKHTKGKWKLIWKEGARTGTISCVPLDIVRGSQIRIATIHACDEDYSNGEFIVKAVNEYDKLKADNARMLEALKNCHSLLKAQYGESYKEWAEYIQTEAAIAQAEGRDNE